jgi:hypothetical protein
MFKELFYEIFSPYSTFGERSLALFILLLIIFMVGLLAIVGFNIADSTAITPTKTVVTTIELKQTKNAYTTMVMAGKVMVSQYHPESYLLHFKIDGEEISSNVDKKFFDSVTKNDKIEVNYGFGRMSHSCVPVTIKIIER